ncbi:hypothetical protein PQR15_16055 [Streptomyces lydicus]|nr:hypothetical protein [Streptomyces lydicus]
MDHGRDGRAAEQQRGGRAHEGVPAALTACGDRAAQLIQRVRCRFEVADAGLQQSPQVVLAAETTRGVAAPVVVPAAATAPRLLPPPKATSAPVSRSCVSSSCVARSCPARPRTPLSYASPP